VSETSPPFPSADGRSLPGILLAAGLSRRMGQSKLTLPLWGRPLLVWMLDAALGRSPSPDSKAPLLNPLVVVIGSHTPSSVTELLAEVRAEGWPVWPVLASRAAEGQAQSLKAGLKKVRDMAPDAPGVMVLLADQPLIPAVLIRDLTDLFWRETRAGRKVCVAPAFQGQRGNPVILHRDLFSEVERLNGDQGARGLLAHLPLCLLDCMDNACLTDVDEPESYRLLASQDHPIP